MVILAGRSSSSFVPDTRDSVLIAPWAVFRISAADGLFKCFKNGLSVDLGATGSAIFFTMTLNWTRIQRTLYLRVSTSSSGYLEGVPTVQRRRTIWTAWGPRKLDHPQARTYSIHTRLYCKWVVHDPVPRPLRGGDPVAVQNWIFKAKIGTANRTRWISRCWQHRICDRVMLLSTTASTIAALWLVAAAYTTSSPPFPGQPAPNHLHICAGCHQDSKGITLWKWWGNPCRRTRLHGATSVSFNWVN